MKHLDKAKHCMRVSLVLGLKGVVLIYTLNELVQGRLKEGKERYYAFFQKAYDTILYVVPGCG